MKEAAPPYPCGEDNTGPASCRAFSFVQAQLPRVGRGGRTMPRRHGPALFARNRCAEKESAAGAALASMERISASLGDCVSKALNNQRSLWHVPVSPLMSAPGWGRGCLRPGSLLLEGQPWIRSARPGGRTRTPGGVLARLAAGFNRVGMDLKQTHHTGCCGDGLRGYASGKVRALCGVQVRDGR